MLYRQQICRTLGSRLFLRFDCVKDWSQASDCQYSPGRMAGAPRAAMLKCVSIHHLPQVPVSTGHTLSHVRDKNHNENSELASMEKCEQNSRNSTEIYHLSIIKRNSASNITALAHFFGLFFSSFVFWFFCGTIWHVYLLNHCA